MELETLFGLIDVIQAAHEQFVAGAINVTRFRDICKGIGFNHNPDGLLSDQDVRANCPSVAGRAIRLDWFHNLLQHGVFMVETNLFLTACAEKLGIDPDAWASCREDAGCATKGDDTSSLWPSSPNSCDTTSKNDSDESPPLATFCLATP